MGLENVDNVYQNLEELHEEESVEVKHARRFFNWLSSISSFVVCLGLLAGAFSGWSSGITAILAGPAMLTVFTALQLVNIGFHLKGFIEKAGEGLFKDGGLSNAAQQFIGILCRLTVVLGSTLLVSAMLGMPVVSFSVLPWLCSGALAAWGGKELLKPSASTLEYSMAGCCLAAAAFVSPLLFLTPLTIGAMIPLTGMALFMMVASSYNNKDSLSAVFQALEPVLRAVNKASKRRNNEDVLNIPEPSAPSYDLLRSSPPAVPVVVHVHTTSFSEQNRGNPPPVEPVHQSSGSSSQAGRVGEVFRAVSQDRGIGGGSPVPVPPPSESKDRETPSSANDVWSAVRSGR